MATSLTQRTSTPIRPTAHAGLVATGMIIAAVAAAFGFAWLNSRYGDWVVDALGLTSPLSQGLAYSAFPAIIGLGICLVRPKVFGLTVGTAMDHLRLILGVMIALSALAAVALLVIGGSPFRGAEPLVQVVGVPVSEELIFRGVLFTAVLLGLRRVLPDGTALPLAVVISAVAFGVAHLNNVGSYDTTFVVLQSAYATILGIGTGYLRATTGSLYPAIAVHAAVNAVALLI